MASGSWIDEIAREELKKLENQHPDRFNSLKSELKLFISDPKLEAFFVLPEPIIPLYPSTQSLPTQESSNNRKRNSDCGMMPEKELKRKRRRKEASSKHDGSRMKNKVEIVIERAEACLERIREIKKSLMPPWLL